MTTARIALASVALCAAFLTPASAAVIVDPVTGRGYTFGWDGGLGPIDSIGDMAETEWSLSLAADGFWSFWVQDDFVPGDEFGLRVDGADVAWDEISYVNGFFTAMVTAFLPAGDYTATLDVTSMSVDENGMPYLSGSAAADIRPVEMPPIPLPASLTLLLAGVGALALFRRRASTQAPAV